MHIKYNVKEGVDVPPEFLDVFKIIELGAEKYGANTWLQESPADSHFNHRDNHASMSRHLAEGYIGGAEVVDPESGLHPYLHLACRALMCYTRIKRDLKI